MHLGFKGAIGSKVNEYSLVSSRDGLGESQPILSRFILMYMENLRSQYCLYIYILCIDLYWVYLNFHFMLALHGHALGGQVLGTFSLG